MAGSARDLFRERKSLQFVGCKEDHQCPVGFNCDVTQMSCRPCLSCETLNRLPGREKKTTCVTSIAACGACFAGLVPRLADNKCLPPADDSQPLFLPYEWAVISIGLLLAVIICVAAVYVLRNFHTMKIRASTRTSVLTPVDVEASAPKLPPSYMDIAESPSANPLRNDDERAPFIKPIPSPPPRDARETAARQAARVFHNPSNLRVLQPPSYDSPNTQEPLQIIQEADTNGNSDENSTNNENAMASEVEESTANETQVSQRIPKITAAVKGTKETTRSHTAAHVL